MNAFVAWNLRLLQSFFSPASAGEEVWISVDPEELDAIGPDLGGDTGFLDAVREGPPWPTIRTLGAGYVARGGKVDLVERLKGLVDQRANPQRRPDRYVDPGELANDYWGHQAPTYLPYLAALVRCCATQDESSYYIELRKSLQLPDTWYSTQLGEMEVAWGDLERWSTRGAAPFGRFKFRRLGGYTRIGTPRSQSIVSKRDVAALTRVFAQTGVRPGQPLSEEVVEDVRLHAASSAYLSVPFKQALAQKAFLAPVRERLRALLSEWDGTVEHDGGTSTSGPRDGRDTARQEPEELEVALGLQPDNSLPWIVRWRVPALRDTGTIQLSSGTVHCGASFAGTSVVTTDTPTEEAVKDDSRKLLVQSSTDDVQFEVTEAIGQSGSTKPLATLRLRRKILRTFVAEVEEVSGNERPVLCERPLPGHGGAYILTTEHNSRNLTIFLEAHRAAFEECSTDGLPEGWRLVYVPDCTKLWEGDSNDFPDGEQYRAQPRVLRLVGGRSVLRAGMRQYLAYDLPMLELDAPVEAEVVGHGLRVSEQGRPDAVSVAPNGMVRVGAMIRRFDLDVLAYESRAFVIEARLNGQVLDTIRLRLAPTGGLSTQEAGQISIDQRGNSVAGRQGLLGGIVGAPASRPAPAEDLLKTHAGFPCSDATLHEIMEGVPARFLDSLAQAGSLAYGTARDQLRRLIARQQARAPLDPALVLRELRSRGHLEIESDSKGRWARIHAVAPFLCVLPIQTPGGAHVASLSGTVRHEHWLKAGFTRSEDTRAYVAEDGDFQVLRPLRIAFSTPEALHRLTGHLQLQVAYQSPWRIADFAVPISQLRDELLSAGVESLGTHSRNIERYNANSGLFNPADSITLDEGVDCQLFKVEDGETGRHNLYVLGYHDQSSRPRFTFVRDSRWGVWLAMDAFAKFATRYFGVRDVSPWPLHYDRRRRTLWLPARINIPVILERALVLCSGARPMEVKACGRRLDDGSIELSRFAPPTPIGQVSAAYDGFSPAHPRWATWLGYRWIPEDVAQLVASKLGAQLVELRPSDPPATRSVSRLATA